VRQKRSLTCGETIAAPLSESRKTDAVQLTVTSAVLRADGIALTYRITAADPKTMLVTPIGTVPPTGLLLEAGRVVATVAPPGPTGIVDGYPALGYPVGRNPYQQNLLVDHQCPGTTFGDVRNHPTGYQVVVVMSVQNAGMPKDLDTPLVQATGTLRIGN
jgi:hypothetical protein